MLYLVDTLHKCAPLCLPPSEATRAAIRAEVARVEALPAEERARMGDKYTDQENLWLALEAGDGNATLILAASWLRKQKVAKGFRLPRRGDPLPPEATLSIARLSAKTHA